MLKNALSFTTVRAVSYALFLIYFNVVGQESSYYRFIDSADVQIDIDTKRAKTFLDSIPEPLEDNISGRLAEYYAIKVLIHNDYKEYTEMNRCNLLALKYAKKEKNYREAGQACLDLFSSLYGFQQDSSLFDYLDKAKYYFEKCDYKHGLLEVRQMKAYAKFLDSQHNQCNRQILEDLEDYKRVVDEDAYFYLFASYMLVSNYLLLNDFESANKHYTEFKSLKGKPGVTDYNYHSFDAAINVTKADVFNYHNKPDSTLFYLKKSDKLVKYMSEDVQKDYYEFYVNAYKTKGDIEASKAYIDSLTALRNKIHKNTVEASFNIDPQLLAENQTKENEAGVFEVNIIFILLGVLLFMSLLSLVFYRKQKEQLVDYSNQSTNFSYLKTNNEKLAVKVQGLEEYIKKLKIEIREISSTKDVEAQKEKIKELYKNVHINSSTILDKSESHLELVNDLNIEFFKEIESKYPLLNKSEIIICYYLFMGFSNKEIAVFLNVSIRSVESRRYRISKKIDFNKKETTLVEHLKHTFR